MIKQSCYISIIEFCLWVKNYCMYWPISHFCSWPEKINPTKQWKKSTQNKEWYRHQAFMQITLIHNLPGGIKLTNTTWLTLQWLCNVVSNAITNDTALLCNISWFSTHHFIDNFMMGICTAWHYIYICTVQFISTVEYRGLKQYMHIKLAYIIAFGSV